MSQYELNFPRSMFGSHTARYDLFFFSFVFVSMNEREYRLDQNWTLVFGIKFIIQLPFSNRKIKRNTAAPLADCHCIIASVLLMRHSQAEFVLICVEFVRIIGPYDVEFKAF